jgi:hypothetical protein
MVTTWPTNLAHQQTVAITWLPAGKGDHLAYPQAIGDHLVHQQAMFFFFVFFGAHKGIV